METSFSTTPAVQEEKLPRRTFTGMLMIAVTLLLQALAAGYTVPYSLRHSTFDNLLEGGTDPIMTALSCLTIIAGIAQLVGFIFLVSSVQNVSRSIKRLCWLAFILFVVAIVLTLIVNIPLGYAVSLGGSRTMGIVSLWVTALSQILNFTSLAILLFALAQSPLKWVGAGIAGLQSVVVLAIAGVSTAFYRLLELTLMGNTMYVPQPEPNPYQPVLSIAGLILSGVFALVFLISTVGMRARLVEEPSDRVV